MPKKKAKKTTIHKKKKVRFVRTERRAMAIRRVRRTILLALIWLLTVVYAAGYVSMVYEKDLRLVAPNVAAQLREETLLPEALTDRVLALLSGRFSLRAEPPVTELQSDGSSFQDVIAVLNNRADLWRNVMVIAMAISILSAGVMHLMWRMRSSRIISPAREVPVVRARFRNLQVICIVINCLLAAVLYRISYEGQTDITWQQLAYNGVFILSPLALTLSTRFTAPMCISGVNCYFR